MHSFYIVSADALDIIEINAHAGDAEKAEFVIYTSPFDRENIVSDVRLLRFKAWPELALVKARRQITISYAEPAETFLDIYQLTYDETEDRYLFIQTQSFKTAARYTNATEAFHELRIQ